MEPDVIRMYSSSPPPLTDDCGADLDDDSADDFGDFGTYCAVPASVSFSELATPTTFNQSEALAATSPPELLPACQGTTGFGHAPSSNGAHSADDHELLKANGVTPAGHIGSAPSERTEVKKVVCGGELADCNGGGDDTPVLTNGFSTFDLQGSPSPPNSVHSDLKGVPPSCEDGGHAPRDDFADFAAFGDSDSACGPKVGGVSEGDGEGELEEEKGEAGELPAQGTASEERLRDQVRTSANSDQEPESSGEFCTNGTVVVNGLDDGTSEGAGPWDGKENDTETETETSLGRPLSTEALEELGDISATTGSAPLGGEAATPADHSQLVEDEDGDDFGDFGETSSFADLQQQEVQEGPSGGSPPPPLASDPAHHTQDEDDFGDFNSPGFDQEGGGGEGEEVEFADFPPSNSFGNFSSAADNDGGWSAFGEEGPGLEEEEGGESWAAFSTEDSLAPPAGSTDQHQQEEEGAWHEGGGATAGRTETASVRI